MTRRRPTDEPADTRAVPELADTHAMLEALPFAALVFSPDLTLLDANARHCAMTGRRRDDVVGRAMFDAFPPSPDGPDTEAVIRASVARVEASGEPDDIPVQQHDLPGRDGEGLERRYWRVTHAPIVSNGAMAAILQISRDITPERMREAKADLHQRAAREAAKIGFWEYDPAAGQLLRSAEVDELFGFAPGEVGPGADAFFARVHPDDLRAVQAENEAVLRAPPGTPGHLEYRLLLPDGTERRVVARGEHAVVADERTGRQVSRLSGIVMDVTAIRARELDLAGALAAQAASSAEKDALLDEKDALLGEMNHRVKNALQLVMSLLKLEAASAVGGPCEAQLEATARRISTIAAVHATLYHSGKIGQIDFAAHLETLCRELEWTARSRGADLSIACRTAPCALEAETAVALSLILNEWLGAWAMATGTGSSAGSGADASADRAAKRDGRRNATVTLSCQEGLVLRLDIETDGTKADGSGSPSSRLASESGTEFGAQLVRILGRQLGADLVEADGAGWRGRIEIPRR